MSANGTLKPKDFEKDERITHDEVNNKFYMKESGIDYEFDGVSGVWTPILNEDDLAQQGAAYEQSIPEKGINNKKKRKNGERENTAVYVSNLPSDVTEAELEQSFSKYGVIAEDLKTGDKKLKLYRDENGKVKGDALIVYFKAESVDYAIEMMNDQELRFGELLHGRIKVEAASYSKDGDGSSNPIAKKKKSDLSKMEKAKIHQSLKRMETKLAEWDDDVEERPMRKNKKVVVLKHMFTLDELEEDDTAEFDIIEDVREECSKLGTVTSIILYNLEPEGILTVKFSEAHEAEAVVVKMNGRKFDGRTIEAWIMEGGERYKKTRRQDEEDRDEERLDKFGKWLENQ